MSTARKFIHEETYKQLDALDIKKTSLLSDLILSSDVSSVAAIEYWKKSLHDADDQRTAVCNNQIDLLERNMMAKAILIEDLLGSIEITGGIPTLVNKEEPVLVNENVSVEELEQKETPVIDIATGKPVGEKAVETTVETPKVESTVTPAPAITERKTLDAIKAEVTVLIQSGKKEEGHVLFAAYMKNGMWLNNKGKNGKEMGDKEFNNAWKDLVRKTELTIVQKHVEATEKPVKEEPVVDAETDIATNPPFDADNAQQLIDFDKAKLALDETNLTIYKKFYPEDKNAEKSVANFSKTIMNVTEEEKALSDVYGKVSALFADNKVNDAAELTRLFFSERPFSDAQVGKWLASANSKEVIDNQLKYLNEKITLQPADSIASIVMMAQEAVQKDNVSRETLMAWFRSNVLNKTLKHETTVITTEEEVESKFKAILNWLFEPKKEESNPNSVKETTDLLTEAIKNADPKSDTFVDIVTPVKEELKKKNIKFSLKDLMNKAKELAKTVNPDFMKAFANRKNAFGKPMGIKDDDIKPNEDFDKGEPVKENPTIASPGKEEVTPSVTEAEPVDAVIEFKTLEDLMYHLTTMKRDNSDIATVTTEAMHYLVDINTIDDAKDWTPEQVKLMVEGIFTPPTAEEPVVETPAVEEPTVTEPAVEAPITEPVTEPAVEPAHPINDKGEPAATVTEAVAPVTTDTTVAKEKPTATTALGPDFRKIHQAMNATQFQTAVREAYVNNKGDDKDDNRIMGLIIGAIIAPNGGKYVNNIRKNKIEEQMKQIKNIIHPVTA